MTATLNDSMLELGAATPVRWQVGYGELGLRGDLGYEGKRVTIAGRTFSNAISTHPPARVLFHLNGAYTGFHCAAALNDDVPRGASHADFAVIADGRRVATAHVVAGDEPHVIDADVSQTQLLELVVTTGRWEYSHAVWLDPRVDAAPVERPVAKLTDALARAAIVVPAPAPRVERCIATVASAGFEGMLDDMLGSLIANGRCPDARLVVFALGERGGCAAIAAKYGALLIPCEPRAAFSPMSKALLYSVARVVDADQFLCLDADMLVLDDLRPVFSALRAVPDGSILACREGNGHGFTDLGHVLRTAYAGAASDIARLVGGPSDDASYPLVVNDGIFAGSRSAMLALDATIRGMPEASRWVDEHPTVRWRNQFVFNLALARLRCGVELDSAYNVQLHVQDAPITQRGARLEATWHGRQARVLHFSGGGRRKYPSWRGLYARAPEPLVGGGDGDPYTAFLATLRAWVGRHGIGMLAWSIYGTSDARSARVRDPGVMPLFALLHYMIRSNGCVRVVEAGTARGVSTACLASAVAHRDGGSVVTFDPHVLPHRAELWETLPPEMGACIEARATGSVEGMTAALAAGERYDAAFLDSIHTEEQVWAEFKVASKLVCPGGIILVHDPLLASGTVEGGLRRIEADGYGVTRLWTAECGVREDDGLGLAVIENRRRA
jgi:predicted O-methyltransferase YrrM